MPPEESRYAADWLRIAEKDLRRVDYLLDLPDPEAAGFFLQQAVEKCLKAFLLSRGWELKRIHDLEVLLNAALEHDPHLEEYRASCQKITGYYLADRYPTMTVSGLKPEDVHESLSKIKSLIEKVRASIH